MADESDGPDRAVRRETVTYEFPVIDAQPLLVDFTPQAIRDHFDGCDPGVDNLSDAQLELVAEQALSDDALWDAFHRVLCAAVLDRHGHDPGE